MRQRAIGLGLVTTFVAIVLTMIVDAAPAGACTCARTSDAVAFARADAVFVGSLTKREVTPQPSTSLDPAVWTFEVRDVYKGVVARDQEIVSALSGAACGLEISGAADVLVFATEQAAPGHLLADGQYAANLCNGTRSVSGGPLQAGLARARPMDGRSYALPSNGWKPGDFSMLARVGGPFHAVLTPAGACAWLGTSDRNDSLWPAGYRVRFDPTRLLDMKGRVVAREGDFVEAGGGHVSAPPDSRCAAGEGAVSIQSKLRRR